MKIEYDPIHEEFVALHNSQIIRQHIDTAEAAWDFLQRAKAMIPKPKKEIVRPTPIPRMPEHLIRRFDAKGRPIIELSDLDLDFTLDDLFDEEDEDEDFNIEELA